MKSHGNWHKVAKELVLKLGLVFLAVLWIAIIAGAWADAAEAGGGGRVNRTPAWDSGSASNRDPAGSRGSDSVSDNPDDEYSFSWLDRDKKIYVLQNRKYLKANHLLVSVMGGPSWSNPYRTVYDLDTRAAFYVSEAFGVEFFYTKLFNRANNTFKALEDATQNTRPVIREIRSQLGGLVHWVPWYSKINVFNQILYFDWYFSGGVGSLHSVLETHEKAGPSSFSDEDRFAFFLGTGHQYHLSQSFVVRMDVTGAFYRALVYGTKGETSWYSNFNFGIGLGYRL